MRPGYTGAMRSTRQLTPEARRAGATGNLTIRRGLLAAAAVAALTLVACDDDSDEPSTPTLAPGDAPPSTVAGDVGVPLEPGSNLPDDTAPGATVDDDGGAGDPMAPGGSGPSGTG